MHFLKKSFYFVLSSGFVLGCIIAFYVAYLAVTLPQVEGIQDFNPPIPSQILSKDGEVLLETGTEDRDIAKISEVPQKVINAFLAAEDSNFYNHHGVDYLGILRAMAANIRAGKVVQGGSTITQQVAKQLYLSRERSFARKIRDMLLALEIEKKFSKDEILYLYLNQVYLGGGYYGVKAALKGYFDKELDEATVAECALVAGLLVAPGRYSPYLNPIYAKRRQNYVLRRLFETNKISQDEYQAASEEVLKFRIKKSEGFKGGHFTDWVRQRVIKAVGKENFYTNGFKVVTTLDWELQDFAEKEILKGVKDIDKRQGFKGPLQTLESDEQIKAYIKKQRESIFVENSLYFELTPNGEKQYELAFNEEELEEIWNGDSLEAELSKRFKLYPSNNVELNKKVEEFLITDNIYDAVITYVDDFQKMVYVSIAGVKGVIPYDYFRWAKERIISEARTYTPDVYNPSGVFKRGQVVRVKILRKNTNPYRLFHKNFIKAISGNKEIIKKYQSQKFHSLALEQESDVEGALLAIHPVTGEIISLVGGADFSKSQFNRALQSLRQPGSSFKPILYAAGLETGLRANDIIIDSPESLGGVDSSLNWKPRNYDQKFLGPITLRTSLEKSRNVPTIKMVNEITVPYIHEFVKRLGIKADLAPDLSLSLGSFGISLLDITKAYAIFPNGGNIVTPKSILSITDRHGKTYDIEQIENIDKEEEVGSEENTDRIAKIIEEDAEDLDNKDVQEEENKKVNPYLENLTDTYVYDKRLAYIMTNLLRGVIQNGTGRGARYVSSFIGGKTGTTNNYVDAWFIGFSSNLSLGVWTGFDNNKTLGWGETGSKAALPIWREYMQKYLKKYGEYDFKIPEGIVNVRIDKSTGKLAKISDQDTIMEAFVVGTEPGVEIDVQEGQDLENTNGILDEDDYFSQQ